MNITSSFNHMSIQFNNNFSKPKEQEEQRVAGLDEINGIDQQNKTPEDKNEKKSDPSKAKKANGEELTKGEEMQISKLKARDAEVRAHEAAHLAVAGNLAAGGASYTYQQGPDGKMYAIGGEVPISMSEGSTPEETAANMRKVRAAALAPASPSGQDLKVASTAAMLELKAQMEITQEKKQEQEESEAKKASNPYELNSSHEQENSLDFVA